MILNTKEWMHIKKYIFFMYNPEMSALQYAYFYTPFMYKEIDTN